MPKQLQIGTLATKDPATEEYTKDKPLFTIATTEIEWSSNDLLDYAKDMFINELLYNPKLPK